MATNRQTPAEVETPVTTEAQPQVTTTPTERPVRRNKGVFNGTRGKLQVGNNIPGYHLHFFIDGPGRIQTALEAGWEFVSPEEVGYNSENVTNKNVDLGTRRVSVMTGTNAKGEPELSYLLKIKEEWFDEDQLELQKRNDMTDASIRSGKVAGVDSNGFYNNGIKY